MNSLQTGLNVDGTSIVRLESDSLRVDVAPEVGGRVVSLIEKSTGHEFLWRNRALPLRLLESGSEYDPNFYGGIDELLPNDTPEQIDGVPCPDHGELWTTPLAWRSEGNRLKLEGTLPRFGLKYEREMSLRAGEPWLDLHYRITNTTTQKRHFLWKLHAALAVQAGDIIDCPARQAQVVDLNYSRFSTQAPFSWPTIEGKAANVIPAANGTMDFFYLWELREGFAAWRRPHDCLEFSYHFDRGVYPYVWMFASYGGFFGHYTVVLEPCTTMPVSVNEAAAGKQCSVLQPGATLETRVSLRAGRFPQSPG